MCSSDLWHGWMVVVGEAGTGGVGGGGGGGRIGADGVGSVVEEICVGGGVLAENGNELSSKTTCREIIILRVLTSKHL